MVSTQTTAMPRGRSSVQGAADRAGARAPLQARQPALQPQAPAQLQRHASAESPDAASDVTRGAQSPRSAAELTEAHEGQQGELANKQAPTAVLPLRPELPPELAASIKVAEAAVSGEELSAAAFALIPAQPDFAALARDKLQEQLGGAVDYASLRFSVRAAAGDAIALAQRCQRGATNAAPVVPSRVLPAWHSPQALEDIEVFSAACAQEVSLRSQDLLVDAAAAAGEPEAGNSNALAKTAGTARNERLHALAALRGGLARTAPTAHAAQVVKDAMPQSAAAPRGRDHHAHSRSASASPARKSVLHDRSNVRVHRARPAPPAPARAIAVRGRAEESVKKPEVAFGRRVHSEAAVGRKKPANRDVSGPAPKRRAHSKEASAAGLQEAQAEDAAHTHAHEATSSPAAHQAVHEWSHIWPPAGAEGGTPAHPWSHMRAGAPGTPPQMPGSHVPQLAQALPAQQSRHRPAQAVQTDPLPPTKTDAESTSEALVAILHGLTAVVKSQGPAPAAVASSQFVHAPQSSAAHMGSAGYLPSMRDSPAGPYPQPSVSAVHAAAGAESSLSLPVTAESSRVVADAHLRPMHHMGATLRAASHEHSRHLQPAACEHVPAEGHSMAPHDGVHWRDHSAAPGSSASAHHDTEADMPRHDVPDKARQSERALPASGMGADGGAGARSHRETPGAAHPAFGSPADAVHSTDAADVAPSTHEQGPYVAFEEPAAQQAGSDRGSVPVSSKHAAALLESLRVLSQPAYAAAQEAVQGQLQASSSHEAAVHSMSDRQIQRAADAVRLPVSDDTGALHAAAQPERTAAALQDCEPLPYVPVLATREFLSMHSIASSSDMFAPQGGVQRACEHRPATPQEEFRHEQFRALESMLCEDLMLGEGALRGAQDTQQEHTAQTAAVHDVRAHAAVATAVQNGDAALIAGTPVHNAPTPTSETDIGTRLQRKLLSQLRGDASIAPPHSVPEAAVGNSGDAQPQAEQHAGAQQPSATAQLPDPPQPAATAHQLRSAAAPQRRLSARVCKSFARAHPLQIINALTCIALQNMHSIRISTQLAFHCQISSACG